jgi:hypothetical protein
VSSNVSIISIQIICSTFCIRSNTFHIHNIVELHNHKLHVEYTIINLLYKSENRKNFSLFYIQNISFIYIFYISLYIIYLLYFI